MTDPFPAEVQAIKDLLKNLIQSSTDPEHLKTHIRFALGLQGETPEMIQLHQMIMEYDKKFNEVQVDRGVMKKDIKVIKWALAAIAAGTPVVQIVLQLLGVV